MLGRRYLLLKPSASEPNPISSFVSHDIPHSFKKKKCIRREQRDTDRRFIKIHRCQSAQEKKESERRAVAGPARSCVRKRHSLGHRDAGVELLRASTMVYSLKGGE